MNGSRHITVAVKTSWNQEFGNGHIQRMAALIWHCFNERDIEAFLWNSETPVFFSNEMRERVFEKKPMDLIIRDMRDSTPFQMNELKRYAPVLAVDDLGEGRSGADYFIDLLPVPSCREYTFPKCFLYGYTFYRSLENIRKKRYDRWIDVAFYPGSSGSGGYVNRISSLLPENTCLAVLGGDRCTVIQNGKVIEDAKPREYGEILLSSRLLIAHFGITLYEARAAGCRVVALNPTEYHSRLADCSPVSLELLNLGTSDNLDLEKTAQVLHSELEKQSAVKTDAGEVYEKVRGNFSAFCRILRQIAASGKRPEL